MNKLNLVPRGKKGAMGNRAVGVLVGVLVLVLLMVNVAPEIFGGIALFNTTATGGNVPTWVPTVINVIVAAGLVMMAWRGFGGK